MILSPLQKYKQELQKACAKANIADWFERYINHARGLGNTDALIHACKARDATLITPTNALAEDIHQQCNIKTTNILNANFAQAPTRSVVDNASILMLVRESRRLAVLAEQLLSLMNQKGMN